MAASGLYTVAILAVIGALGAVVAGVVTVVRRVGPVVQRAVRFFDDWHGSPARPGVAARPGVMERLAELEVRTAELAPNGGGSIKDQITRMDKRLTEISGRLRAVERHTCPPHEAE